MSGEDQDRARWLAAFRQAALRGVQTWLQYVKDHQGDFTALGREFANLSRAADLALQDRQAWQPGRELAMGLFRYMEVRGYWQTWHDTLQKALAVSRQIDDPVTEAKLLDQTGYLWSVLGNYRQAQTYYEQALASLEDLDDSLNAAWVHSHLAEIYQYVGELDKAETACGEAISIFEAHGELEGLAQATNNWGAVCMKRGLGEQALAHYERAASLFHQTGNLRGVAKTLNNRGDACRHLDRTAEAIAWYQQAIDLAETEVGDLLQVATSKLNLAIILHDAGDHKKALALNREIRPTAIALSDRIMLARLANNDGVFLMHLGRHAEAETAFHEALDLYKETGTLFGYVLALQNMAELMHRAGRPAEAVVRLETAQAVIDQMPAPPPFLRQHQQEVLALLAETAPKQ